MKEKTIFLALLLFIATSASSEALRETTLKEANFPGLTVYGAMQEQCSSLVFVKDALAEEKGVFIILSLHASFQPTSNGNAEVQVLNTDGNKLIADLKTKDFLNDWARVEIPKQGLVEKNNLKVCAKTSNSITKIEIIEDSKIGYYKMPVFEIEKTVAKTKPIVGKEVEVTVKATNIGSEVGKAKVSYWNVELDIAQITKGDSEFEGTIQPGQTVTMHYFVKPKYAVQMDLLPAIIEFENIFGEKQKIYSERPTLYVQEPEFQIKGAFSTGEQQTIPPGRQASILLTVRNDGLNDLENVAIELEAPSSIQLSKTGFEALNFKAGETKTFALTASGTEEGTQQIGCNITYTDYALAQTKCNPISLDIEKPKQNQALILAVILLLVGAVIYIYIYKPEKKKKAEAD